MIGRGKIEYFSAYWGRRRLGRPIFAAFLAAEAVRRAIACRKPVSHGKARRGWRGRSRWMKPDSRPRRWPRCSLLLASRLCARGCAGASAACPTDRSLATRRRCPGRRLRDLGGLHPGALVCTRRRFPADPWVWLAAWLALVDRVAARRLARGRIRAAPRRAWGRGAVGRALACARQPPRHGSRRCALASRCTALAIAWSANLFNFMDGNDGLAGMMAIGGFAAWDGALAVAAAGMAGDARCAPTRPLLALAAARFPSSPSISPRPRFHGRRGRGAAGFSRRGFGVAGGGSALWPGWFPLLVFLPFVADATATLRRAVRRRERVWEAHRTHYYQRLHQLGARTRRHSRRSTAV